ncbi:beta-ketoacyl-ACP synthase III [Denitratisoma oestradiolicum]|uniref:Beta-ketoacyl-[acyl-carrier-protein] synthase III n=1 Tax=Denitratisoma oestradiolicum TaxID=311182 RepID=A0A6S6XTQ4_9PROT|nr:beta-ketoacyl-ACP synthase III [Denitratisoma oestradiolicum]TWO80285.1 3-oxoacyl-ACP synthase [Denitratisoma oestradiolicum]CAB1369380.1 3-oxoacyl-[acyl-carrier-protein] synthase III [Denitratisoma oestradiolicum]
MNHAKITGTGSYLPGEPISNAALIAAHQLESNDDWIVDRTGIRFRYLAPAGVASSDLAAEACRRALEAAGRRPDEVDLIIVATSTPDYIFPSTAAILQSKLGVANNSPAFDVQAVCTGFAYALSIAEKFIRAGDTRCALVVGAEVFSRILDWKDRGTCVLFGDGAGAVVLEASDTPGILSSALHADGSHHGILSVPGHLCGGLPIGDPFLRMDGQAVFKFAVRVLAEVAHEVLEIAGKTIEQVDWLIPHQANVRIIQATGKKLGLPAEKCIVTVDRHGNTSAASIPLALDEAVRAGTIQRGDTILLEGVGGGFTWGASLLTF